MELSSLSRYERHAYIFLEKEHERWLCMQDLISLFYNLGTNKRESAKILERWLICSANLKNKDDAILSLDFIKKDHTIKLMSELEEKKFSHNSTDSKNIVDQMDIIIKKFFDRAYKLNIRQAAILKDFVTLKIEHITDQGKSLVTFLFGSFFFKLSKERYDILLFSLKDKVYDEYIKNLTITKMLIRYDCLCPIGQQWNIDFNTYVENFKKYNLSFEDSIEGFASPINSQFLKLYYLISKAIHLPILQPAICTVFKDTDELFGSIGSIFIRDPRNRKVILNPPFTLDLMEETYTYCDSWCRKVEEQNLEIAKKYVDVSYDEHEVVFSKVFCFFSVTVSSWRDANYFMRFSSSKFLKDKIEHKANTYYYEDSINNTKFLAPFDSTTFILEIGL